MRSLFLARHGATRLTGRVLCGQLDPGLSATGRGQAESLGYRLRDERFDRCWCSPARRVTETLDIAFMERTGIPVELHPHLLERNGGAAQGRLAVSALWREPDMDGPIDGAESLPAFAERIAAFLVEAHRQDWERGIIFTHGGVIAVMQWLVEGGNLAEWVRGMPDPGEIGFLDLPSQLAFLGLTGLPSHGQPAAVEMLYSGLTS